MTEILLDPEELEAVATCLRGVAAELSQVTAASTAACSCVMPAQVAGYVEGEVARARAMISEAAVGYSSAADDVAARAALISQDQSLVTAMPVAFGGPAPVAWSPTSWTAPDYGMSEQAVASDWLDQVVPVDQAYTPVEPTNVWPTPTMPAFVTPLTATAAATPVAPAAEPLGQLSGTAMIDPGLYAAPTLDASTVSLLAALAAPTSGGPGLSIDMSGGGILPEGAGAPAGGVGPISIDMGDAGVLPDDPGIVGGVGFAIQTDPGLRFDLNPLTLFNNMLYEPALASGAVTAQASVSPEPYGFNSYSVWSDGDPYVDAMDPTPTGYNAYSPYG